MNRNSPSRLRYRLPLLRPSRNKHLSARHWFSHDPSLSVEQKPKATPIAHHQLHLMFLTSSVREDDFIRRTELHLITQRATKVFHISWFPASDSFPHRMVVPRFTKFHTSKALWIKPRPSQWRLRNKWLPTSRSRYITRTVCGVVTPPRGPNRSTKASWRPWRTWSAT